jgi:hypothetical protein
MYFAQVQALQRAYEGSVRLLAVEGDSLDNTATWLQKYADASKIDLELVTRSHGGPVYGSTEHPSRMTALSMVGNGIFEHVRATDDVLVYVESDLLWDATTVLRLVAQLGVDVDVIAPLIFAGQHFYDIWGYRLNSTRFSPFPPYHAGLHDDTLTEVESVGSCLVMRAAVARECRIINNACLVGFCDDVRRKGHHIFVDARERIEHPA